MEFATTMYCDKCGKIWIIFPPYTENSTICSICKNTIKNVPNNYFENLSNEGFLLSKNMEQKLINDLVLTSSNFDQYLFDHRDEILSKQSAEFRAKMEHGKAVLEGKSRVPKCPTCQSTNICKMSGLESGASIAMFGIFSKKINKTFKCNNCGYMW